MLHCDGATPLHKFVFPFFLILYLLVTHIRFMRKTAFVMIHLALMIGCFFTTLTKVEEVDDTPFASSIAYAEPTPEITPLPGQVNPYKTRSELLMAATNYVGALTPDQAATIWAEGLTHRSAAMQYIVMTEKLKSEYARQLDAVKSNWVTGMSSPWVGGFTFEKINNLDNLHAEIDIKFEIVNTASPPKYYNAKLWLIKEDGFWRISRISTDKELTLYTFYTPAAN